MPELQSGDGKNGDALMETSKELKERCKTTEEDNDDEMAVAWDDVSGAALDPVKVIAARVEEVSNVRKINLYIKVPVSECVKRTAHPPTSIRWIDINKGDTTNPNYRSRLVAREINIHAATPPLEALKIISAMVTICNEGGIVMTNDISHAFFHAKAKREVFVQLPTEDVTPEEKGMCGKFNYSMYGTRAAAQNWFEECSRKLIENGFTQGKATPWLFYNKERATRAYVLGDDYVSTGMPDQGQWLRRKFEETY